MVKLPVHVAAAMLVLALVSFGCDPAPELSDEKQYRLRIDLGRPLGSQSHYALVGSTFTLSVADAVAGEVDDDQGGTKCATRSGSGVVVELEDGEFVIMAAGEGAVELADPGLSCPANMDILAELGPDRWSVMGTDPADAIGSWAHWPDAYVRSHGMSPGPQGVFPDVIGRPITDLRVVGDPGSGFSVSPALARIVGDEAVEVRWSDEDMELVMPAHYDHLRPRGDDGRIFQELSGTMRARESFSASVMILGSSFELPEVRAVPLAAVRSLELVPVYESGDSQREWGLPAGVIAVARDGEGRRVLGAPVEYELTDGHLSFQSGGDVLYLADTCGREPSAPTARMASIVASLGELQASADLRWIALPEDEHSSGPECVQACACTSATVGESTPGLLALIGLGVWLRRRKREGE